MKEVILKDWKEQANDIFGQGNYLKDIPVKLLENEQFIGNLSTLNSKRLIALQSCKVPVRAYRKIPTVI